MTNEIDSSEDMVAMPKSFGTAFREAREQAGFSIERAAVATRISASFIEALEKQNFKVLPGEIFGRGFVRNLCRAYSCDAKPLVAAYDLAVSSQPSEASSDSIRDQKSKSNRVPLIAHSKRPTLNTDALQKNLDSVWKFAKPAVIAVPILLGALWVGQTLYQSYKSTSSEPKAAEPVQVATPEPAPVAPAAVAETPVAEGTPTPIDVSAVIVGTGVESVDLVVKEPVQVRYGRDKDKQIIETLQPQSYRFQFDEQLRLLVNDMSVVEIRFKGQLVPNKAVKGEGRYMTFVFSEGAVAKNPEKPKL